MQVVSGLWHVWCDGWTWVDVVGGFVKGWTRNTQKCGTWQDIAWVWGNGQGLVYVGRLAGCATTWQARTGGGAVWTKQTENRATSVGF